MRIDGVEQPTVEIINSVLLEIQDYLERSGFTLTDFQLPTPYTSLVRNCVSREIREETSYDVARLIQTVHSNLPKLNDEQKKVYDAVMESIENDNGSIIALDALGGTGKTFLLALLLATVRSKMMVALATATSGIAATLLPNGRTLHSRFKVPLNIKDNSTCNISKRDSTAVQL